jgi:carbamoyl-phosphate synthase large subunit
METARRIKRISKKIAKELNISGPFNIQYLAKNNDVKVIECNLRASRSFPFVSKILKRNFIETATRIMLGEQVEKADSSTFDIDYIGIKASQFSFARLHKADPVLGVDMASTGEVGCLGADFDEAMLNAMISVGHHVPDKNKAVLVSSGDVRGKVEMLDCCKVLAKNGYKLYATEGTAKYLVENGVPAERVIWPTEAQNPELAGKYKAAMDMLANKELDLVINIPKNFSTGELTNGYHVRRAAIDYNIPLITNARLATAFIRAFCAMSIDDIQIKSWDQY